jgi:hypothetical protein
MSVACQLIILCLHLLSSKRRNSVLNHRYTCTLEKCYQLPTCAVVSPGRPRGSPPLHRLQCICQPVEPFIQPLSPDRHCALHMPSPRLHGREAKRFAALCWGECLFQILLICKHQDGAVPHERVVHDLLQPRKVFGVTDYAVCVAMRREGTSYRQSPSRQLGWSGVCPVN